MDQLKKFFNQTLIQIDGMTFTVGLVAVLLVVGYLWYSRK